MPEEVKEEVDQVKVVNHDHDVDDSDDHYDIYGDDGDEEVNQVQGGQSQLRMSLWNVSGGREDTEQKLRWTGKVVSHCIFAYTVLFSLPTPLFFIFVMDFWIFLEFYQKFLQ